MRFDNDDIQQLDEIANREGFANRSEAIRHCIRNTNENSDEKTKQGFLQWFSGKVGEIFAVLAIGWLAATFYYPVGFRAPALAFLVFAVVFLGIERILARTTHPDAGEWLPAWLGGDRA